MNVPEQLSIVERLLNNARAGDTGATEDLRELVAGSARSAPPGDLIEIADFVTGFLRRHVRQQLSNN